jgi:hypothetical protein
LDYAFHHVMPLKHRMKYRTKKRQLIKYAETIGTEVIEINEDTFNGISRPSPVVVIIKVGIADTIDTAFIAVST